jgi:hypothetical protein
MLLAPPPHTRTQYYTRMILPFLSMTSVTAAADSADVVAIELDSQFLSRQRVSTGVVVVVVVAAVMAVLLLLLVIVVDLLLLLLPAPLAVVRRLLVLPLLLVKMILLLVQE